MKNTYKQAAAYAAAILDALPNVMSYSDLATVAGGNKRLVGEPLDLVARLCIKHSLPHLTLMVSTAGTKDDLVPMPGATAFDDKDRVKTLDIPRYEIGAWQAKVRGFDWNPHYDTLTNPGAYADLDAPETPPEIIQPITRRVPESMVAIVDGLIEGLRAMPPAARASVAPKLFEVIAAGKEV